MGIKFDDWDWWFGDWGWGGKDCNLYALSENLGVGVCLGDMERNLNWKLCVVYLEGNWGIFVLI